MGPKKLKGQGGEGEQQDDMPSWAARMFEKLNKLDTIEKSINDLTNDMNGMNTSIEELNTSVKEITQKNITLESRVLDAECENIKLKKEVSDLKDKLQYIECQSRRNNVIFDGVPEDLNENWAKTEAKIKRIIHDLISEEDPPAINIERAHRIGQLEAVKNNKPRQIVVKFASFKDRDYVWKLRSNLDNSGSVRMFEDYPPEVREKRQILWPVYQAARFLKTVNQIKTVHLSIDKLYIDSKLYTVDNLGDLPQNLQPQQRSVRSDAETLVFLTKYSIFSNFHPMIVKIEGQQYSCNEQYFQSAKAILFNDLATADKIMKEKDPVKMSLYGKSVKGFRKDVWQNKAHDILKKVNVCKYEQNEIARDALVATGTKRLGEASIDSYYGIGVHLHNKDVLNHVKWSGQNVMGSILTEIRDSITL